MGDLEGGTGPFPAGGRIIPGGPGDGTLPAGGVRAGPGGAGPTGGGP